MQQDTHVESKNAIEHEITKFLKFKKKFNSNW